jgi:hypothetical protein
VSTSRRNRSAFSDSSLDAVSTSLAALPESSAAFEIPTMFEETSWVPLAAF